MKVLLAVLLLLSAAAGAGAQASVGVQPNNGNTIVMAEHPRHADAHELSTGTSLLCNDAYAVASGEQPLTDYLSPLPIEKSLGEVARECRHSAPVRERPPACIYMKHGECQKWLVRY